MEELDLEALEPVPDLSYAPPSATAQDVQARAGKALSVKT